MNTQKKLKMKRWLFLYIIFVISGCAGPRAGGRNCIPPDFVGNPHADDEWHLYEIGSAVQVSSPEEARKNAYQSALELFALKIQSAVKVGDGDVVITAEQYIRGVERAPFDRSREECSDHKGYSCWTLFRYPREEYEKAVSRIRQKVQFLRDYERACLYIAKSELLDAKILLQQLLEQYYVAQPAGCSIDDIHLRLGDVYSRLKNHNKARSHYQVVIDSQKVASKNLRYARKKLNYLDRVSPAPRMWVLRERWDNGPVALAAYIHSINQLQGQESNSKVARLILSLLKTECDNADLPSFDVTEEVLLEDCVGTLDKHRLSLDVKEATASREAKVVLGIVVTIDRSAKDRMIRGNRRPAIGTTIRFFVGRVSDGKVIYQDDFIYISDISEYKLSHYVVNILLDDSRPERYLIPKCPNINIP